LDVKLYYNEYWRGSKRDRNALYADPPTWPEKETRRLLGSLRGIAEGVILDAGCGDGTFDRILCAEMRPHKLFGLDISHTAIRKAHQASPCDHSTFSVGDSTSLPYKDRLFDCVLLIEVLEHIFDVPRLLSEVRRVLKDGGKAFITTTDFNLLKRMFISIFCFERYFFPTNPHIRFFTRRSLKTLLTDAGFKEVSYRWNGSYLGLMPMGQMAVCQKV
jgi:ubiquinone/menaquinone biosynthesis C-methylase UbiE